MAFIIYATDHNTEDIERRLEQWYKQKADVVINTLLHEIFPLFTRYKIRWPKLLIRKMSKRWDSFTKAGKIILNAELIKAPKGSIEYVMIHELCLLV